MLIKRIINLAAILLLTMSCAFGASKGKPSQRYKLAYFNLQPFNKLAVHTQIHAHLQNSKHYQVVIQYPKHQHAPLRIEQKEGTLTLYWQSRPDKLNNIRVIVKAPNINHIDVYDKAKVHSHHIKLQPLSLANHDQGEINLNGRIQLLQAKQLSTNPITVSMVHSSTLNVTAKGAGAVYLAGTAETAYAWLQNDAYLDSRYLRARKLWIKTTDKASADVLATQQLNAFAYGVNNINYYKTPDFAMFDSTLPADVLQKDFWN
jgi:hypothetical protein